MNTILFILKIAGVLISGVTTLVAIFRSKSFEELEIPSPIIGGASRIEKRITREGKISAILAIVGIATSLIAQIIEQAVTNKRNAEAQATTSNQLQRTEESLYYLERLGTRFDTLSFSITFRLNTNNSAILTEFVNRQFPEVVSNLLRHSSQSQSNKVLQQTRSSFRKATRQPVFSTNVVGYANAGTNTIFLDLQSSNEITIPLSKDALEVLAPSGSGGISDGILNRFYKPDIYLAFGLRSSASLYNYVSWREGAYLMTGVKAGQGDFSVRATNITEVPLFTYRRAAKELYIKWTFDCPKASWTQTKRISSLRDLADAKLYLQEPSAWRGGLTPVSATLNFDTTAITLTKFTTLARGAWLCTLPSKQQILGLQ